MKLTISILIAVFFCFTKVDSAIIADHTCTTIENIPVDAIENAKAKLHIGYGHTSHGSQITDGMTGLVSFMNSKGYPHDLFAWSHTGTNGTLHLYEGDGYGEGDLDHDAGYYPDWVNETRDFLAKPDHGMNVIMWSWCGQLSGYSSNDVQTKYLDEMVKLENDFPDITFVYMTGHSDGSGLEGALHKNNQQIRQFCEANDKVLFDFYDIECYDPDGRYYGDKYVTDNCSYDGGNWAQDWQNSHQQGVDWYNCGAAHSEPLNANQKAYAIWWLWARLAGWDEATDVQAKTENLPHCLFTLHENYPNPFNSSTTIRYSLHGSATVSAKIYDVYGRQVWNQPAASQRAGEYAVYVNLQDQPSGLYFYCLQVDESQQTRRLLYVR